MLGGAGIVGVFEGVAAAIDARALAVPHAEHAIVLGAGIEVDLLGAPQGGCRQVLIEAGLEFYVVLLDEALGLPQRLVETTERRAAIAGDVAAGIEPGCEIALALHHGQADQRLSAGQIDPAPVQQVFIVQGYREGHGKTP